MTCPFKRNLFSSTFTWSEFIQYEGPTFESVDEILWCDHSNETSSVALSHGTIFNLYFLTFSRVCGRNTMVFRIIQMKPL